VASAQSVGQLTEFGQHAVQAACMAHTEVLLQGRPDCECTPQDSRQALDRMKAALRPDGPVMAIVGALVAADVHHDTVRWALEFTVLHFVEHVTSKDGETPNPRYDGTSSRTLNSRAKAATNLLASLEEDQLVDFDTEPLDTAAEDLHERAVVARQHEEWESRRRQHRSSGAPGKISTDLARRLDHWMAKAEVPHRHALLADLVTELFDKQVSGETLRKRLGEARRRAAHRN